MMNVWIKVSLTALLILGFAPTNFALPPDFVDYVVEACEGDADGTDAWHFYLQCSGGTCFTYFELCGIREPNAKYRIHFDTAEPYFDDLDNNEECFTTSDFTAMYRRASDAAPGKLTGPAPSFFGDYDSWIKWEIPYGELGIEAGDPVAAWLDIHKQGIKDRVPDTDDADGCAKPQYPGEVLEIIAN